MRIRAIEFSVNKQGRTRLFRLLFQAESPVDYTVVWCLKPFFLLSLRNNWGLRTKYEGVCARTSRRLRTDRWRTLACFVCDTTSYRTEDNLDSGCCNQGRCVLGYSCVRTASTSHATPLVPTCVAGIRRVGRGGIRARPLLLTRSASQASCIRH